MIHRVATVIVLAVLSAAALAGPAVAGPPLVQIGTSTLGGPAASAPEPSLAQDLLSAGGLPGSFQSPTINAIRLTRFPSDQAGSHIPTPTTTPIATSNPGFSGFAGLTHRDHRLADGGNQFSVEPPDQGLCVGGGYVVEPVNSALAVYDTGGARIGGPVSVNRFFGFPSQFDRSTGIRGPFLSDPRCLYDADTGRFFFVMDELDTNPVTGAFTGPTSLMVAVSKTGDPRGSWRIYRLDTTNPAGPGCPCFADFPGIGADATGFYISANEYAIHGGPLLGNGAEIFAMSKWGLASGSTPTVVRFAGFDPLAGGNTIRPAFSPAASYDTGHGGTEYLVSTLLPFTSYVDDRLVVWALTGTSSLGSATPSLQLTQHTVSVEPIASVPDAEQEPGPQPLADLVTQLFQSQPGNGPKEHLEVLEAVARLPGQVVYADGKLWTAMDTGVKPPTGPTRVGGAWFVVQPSFTGGAVDAAVVSQGYLAVSNANVINPTIAVNAAGNAAIGFTLVGPNMFPSAAYTSLDLTTGTSPVHVAQAGAAPEDGLTGYAAFGGNGVARWGDYSAATAAPDGTLWLATEDIPNAPRTSFANWGTFITQLVP